MRPETVFHYKISSDYVIVARIIHFSAGFPSGDRDEQTLYRLSSMSLD